MSSPAPSPPRSSSERALTSSARLALALALALAGSGPAVADDLRIGGVEVRSDTTTRIRVHGSTDLPDGTRLWIRVVYGPYKQAFLRELADVKDGKFDKTLGPYPGLLFPDRYELGVSFHPTQQPARLRQALRGRTAFKVQQPLAHQLDRRADARRTALEQVQGGLSTLRDLSATMRKRIVALRALEKARKLPAGKALAAWQKKGSLWDVRYDALRKANDERTDRYLLLPSVRTDRSLQRVINYLLDFQYEYRAILARDKDGFAVSRNVRTLSMLLFEADGWFRYEQILLAADPATALRDEIVRLGRQYQAAATRELPAAAQVEAALGKLERHAADGRKLALYELLLDREKRRAALVEFFGKAQPDPQWLDFANQWLHELRIADWEFAQERHRTPAGVPGTRALAHKLQTAALIELARLAGAAGRIPALPAGQISDARLPAPAELVDRAIERYGLARIHADALRHQAGRLARMAGQLGDRAARAAQADPFDHDGWAEWSQIYDSQLLRLSMFELPALGPLSRDSAAQQLFAKRQGELKLLVTRLMELKLALEVALAGNDRAAAVPPLRKRLDALAGEVSTFGAGIQ